MQAPRVGDVLKIWRQAGKKFGQNIFLLDSGEAIRLERKFCGPGCEARKWEKKEEPNILMATEAVEIASSPSSKNISKSLLPLHLLRENEFPEILKTEKHIVVFRNRSGNSSVPAGSHGYGGKLGLDGRTMQDFSLQPDFLGSGGIESAP